MDCTTSQHTLTVVGPRLGVAFFARFMVASFRGDMYERGSIAAHAYACGQRKAQRPTPERVASTSTAGEGRLGACRLGVDLFIYS